MEKTERLGLLLTPKEKTWVIKLAEIEGGLSQAALVRRLIRKAAETYRLIHIGDQTISDQ
jgi:hypothetical protein